MRNRRASAFLAFLLGAAAGLGLYAPRAAAESAILTRSGNLYEVYATTYGRVVSTTDEQAARQNVLALRITSPDGSETQEIVEGTLDANPENSESVEFDENTQTLFVVYTQYQGLMSDLHIAVRRDGSWMERRIAPNAGLYLSLNPKVVISRQRYTDVDSNGESVWKYRSILSIVWWEESGVSQARYAALFVEDGALDLDNPVVVNLNDLTRSSQGTTDAKGRPTSSYQFPAIQRDATPTSNGAVFVSFANLLSQSQDVLRITFPEDVSTTDTSHGPEFRRGHIPAGTRVGSGSIPGSIDTSSGVDTILSADGVPTFYWQDVTGTARAMRYVHGDDPAATIFSIPLRDDFGIDRAKLLLRDLVEKQ
jgi:hypothetical protein